MNVIAILQARMSSKRLPRKVLSKVMGKPLLQLQLERLSGCATLDKVVVAIPSGLQDSPIADLCTKLKVTCFRGDEFDVLDRYYQAAKRYNASHIVRLTGDCPLADADVIDQMVNFHCQGNYDYSSNCYPASFPDGLDVEILNFDVLQKIHSAANLASEREHVTLYIRNHSQAFNIGALVAPINNSHLRWTVDEPEDLLLINKIFAALYPADQRFNYQDILQLISQHPELASLNIMHQRNQGLTTSLLNDRIVNNE
jgi:spore coat polysaccharide biosynthesis protein SpsF